ncbi:MAG: CDP-glycerol glycerophosphotransferase family protein [Anaerolineae bacterium]|nr:CDP-glycerol glycerophosphotransferase family protein [Anaerolineae bacterium]
MVRRRRRLFRLAQLVLFKVVYLLTWLLSWGVPRKRGVVVFSCGTGSNYGGNPRYLYEAALRDGRLHPIWVHPYRKPVPANGPWRYSPRGVWTLLRAEAWVVDNHLYTLFPHVHPRGKMVFQLWHGVGLKRIALGDKRARPRDRRKIQRDTARYTLFFTTSEFMAEHFSRILAVPRERMAITGYPRNDILFRADAHRALQAELRSRLGDARSLILYAPTWDPRREAVRTPWPFDDFDIGALNELLERYDALFVVKLHWHMRHLLASLESHGRVRRYDEIFGDRDVQQALALADVLVTDISSIAYDYILLDRPIIIAHPDLEGYDRAYGLVEGYRELLPGEVMESFDALLRRLEQVLRGEDPDAERRKRVSAIFHRYVDGDSSRRCLDEMVRTLGVGEA